MRNIIALIASLSVLNAWGVHDCEVALKVLYEKQVKYKKSPTKYNRRVIQVTIKHKNKVCKKYELLPLDN